MESLGRTENKCYACGRGPNNGVKAQLSALKLVEQRRARGSALESGQTVSYLVIRKPVVKIWVRKPS